MDFTVQEVFAEIGRLHMVEQKLTAALQQAQQSHEEDAVAPNNSPE